MILFPVNNKDFRRRAARPYKRSGLWALSPLVVFLLLYLVSSVAVGDFYKVPITVAFLLSAVYALATMRGVSFADRLSAFSAGAAHRNVMLMIWIFILAGAFAVSAKAMGAIDATVNLTLQFLPGQVLLSGIFLASCFISLAVGTSVGTIVALVPVAVGLAEAIGVPVAMMTAIVVGGSFFGDNLSFISDTTIAATRTQECSMRDKFRVNSLIVVPVAVVVLLIYLFEGFTFPMAPIPAVQVQWVRVVPYLIVLGTAIAGVNVLLVLVIGLLATGVIGLLTGGFGLFDWFGAMGAGVAGMGDLIVVTLLAAGMLALVRRGGGITYMIWGLTRRIRSRRGAELSIAGLVSVANLCTANNTIAILTVGPIARDIATRFGVDARKSASLLDTFSCFVQGVIPYGAQLLIAASLATVSGLEIIRYLYYPFLLGLAALLAVVFRYPRRYS